MNQPSKVQKLANYLIRSGIFAVTFLFIYQQVFHRTDLPALFGQLEDDLARPGFNRLALVILLLMLLNWALEALKWRFLIGKVEKVSFFKSFQAVLAGVSVSSFTPNRVGEFFGRVFILKRASRIEGTLITVVGSVSQLLVTVIAGSAAMLVFIPEYLPLAAFSHGYLYFAIVATVLALDLLLIGLFFNLSVLTALKERILKNRLKRIRPFFRVFAFFHNRELALVMLISASRYLVFSTQFFLLLRLFGLDIIYPEALVLISMIYFVMAIIPTVALTELGIRGSVALYFFGLYFDRIHGMPPMANGAVFAASTMLWMINLGFPALVGALFVFRLQFFRKSDREADRDSPDQPANTPQ